MYINLALALLVAILLFSLSYKYFKAKNQLRSMGILMILLGIGILISSFLFSSGYDPIIGLLGSITKMEVVLKEGAEVPASTFVDPPGERYFYGPFYVDRVTFPLKYSLLLSVLLILVGFGIMVIDRKRPPHELKPPNKSLQPTPPAPLQSPALQSARIHF